MEPSRPVLHCQIHDVFTLVEGLPSMWRGDVRFTWVNLGEGLSGDFDKEKADDVNLLRFEGFRFVDGEWVEVPDSSYATQMPANTPYSVLRQALIHIQNAVHDVIVCQGRAKRELELLSWISPELFAPAEVLDAPLPHLVETT